LKEKPELSDQKLETVYFGGGTPSLLESEQLDELFRVTKKFFAISSEAEITLEANPNDILGNKLVTFRKLGVNRLSIGVQSLNDEELKTLGREHTAIQALDAARNARKSGFENLNLDLIFGVPGQTLKSWQKTLEQAIKARPSHFSTYSLTIEERTFFFKLQQQGKLRLPPDDACQEMYLTGVEFLEKEGYRQYEISNFAQPEFESKHNRNYWERKSYLGIGPSAHSFNGAKRWANVRSLNIYQEKLGKSISPLEFEEIIDLKQALEETIFLGLRQKEGVCFQSLKNEFKYDLAKEKNDLIHKLVAQNYTLSEAGRLKLTTLGFYISDKIASELFP